MDPEPTSDFSPKRASAGDDNMSDDFESEFILLIPDDFVGCVLGRGGSTIRRLQWQTHTTIKVSNADEPFYPGTEYRMVTIVSSSTAAMDAAQQLILMQIAQNYSKSFREVSAKRERSASAHVREDMCAKKYTRSRYLPFVLLRSRASSPTRWPAASSARAATASPRSATRV